MEAVVSLSGQGIDANLSAQAFSELAFRARSVETMQVTVEDTTDSRLGQINAGDTVRVKSNQGYMTIADVYRVVTVEVSINDLGIARQKFSLASVGASTGRL
jgi:molecular chaperone DnaK (HSP70)